MKYKPTQLELAERARRYSANLAHAINEMMQDPNRPTLAELEKLRKRNPRIWNSYPEAGCIDAPTTNPQPAP